jgi:hypothetical protein
MEQHYDFPMRTAFVNNAKSMVLRDAQFICRDLARPGCAKNNVMGAVEGTIEPETPQSDRKRVRIRFIPNGPCFVRDDTSAAVTTAKRVYLEADGKAFAEFLE